MVGPGRVVRPIAMLVLTIALSGLNGCGRDQAGRSDSAGGRSYASLEAFRAASVNPSRRQVVFVGIDAAAWRFIDPLIASGRLPNLARVKHEGAAAVLRSIPCYVSPPAWTTMLTGDLPARTGVYSYGKWVPQRREFTTVDATDVRVPPVWEVASYCGRKVGVFNVPMSYPPAPVDGAVVGGMMTPYDMSDPIHGRPLSPRPEWTPKADIPDYAPVRRTATTDSLNDYLWSMHDTTDDGTRNYDTVVLEVRPGGDVYTFPVDAYSPWVRIRTLRDGTIGVGYMKAGVFADAGGYDTRLSPVFAPIGAPFTQPASLAEVLKERFGFYVPSVFLAEDLVESLARDAAKHASFFYDMDDWDLYMYVFTQSDNMHHHAGLSERAASAYETIDRFLGELMGKMPPGATLVIASDHGFAEYEWGIDLNRMFEEMGLLIRGDDGKIDYDRTLVFHNLWHLWFNHPLVTREELASRGIEVPGGADPVDYLAAYLIHVASAIQTADGVHNVSLNLVRLPDDGDPATPDMRVDGASGEYVVDFVYENRHNAVFHRLEGHDRFWHQRDGIVMAWGNHVTAGASDLTYDIQDVAPTLLSLLGVPVADDMDGHFMDGLFEPIAPVTVPDYTGMPEAPVAEKKSTESLEKKLKSLGYLR